MKITIRGPATLRGKIRLSGFKHSVIPIIASSLMTEKRVILKNVPNIKDVRILCKLFRIMGGYAKLDGNKLTIEMKNIKKVKLPPRLVGSVHGTIYLIPSLLARTGKVNISCPGGCKIGRRPLTNIAFVIRKLGAVVKFDKNIHAKVKSFIGDEIILNFKGEKYYSGATKAAIIAGSMAKGKTIIKNAFVGLEIVELANFLRMLGTKIRGDGTKQIIITGVKSLRGGNYSIAPDLIEFGTFSGVAAVTRSKIIASGISIDHLEYFKPEIDGFKKMGIKFKILNKKTILIDATKNLRGIKISSPPIYSDLQPIFSATLTTVNGKSEVIDNVWEKRFRYVNELKKMGADISLDGNKLSINGGKELYGKNVVAKDLRSVAALILAGLYAKGTTVIHGAEHLERGYENLVSKLKELGAEIKG